MVATIWFAGYSALLAVGAATFGVDVSSYVDEFTCLRRSYGCNFTISRAWMSYGAFDSSSVSNLKNAATAGIPFNDVYMFPCRGKSASYQVDTMMADLSAGFKSARIDGDQEKNATEPRGLRARQGFKNAHSQGESAEIEYGEQFDRDWRAASVADPSVNYGMIWMDIEENPSYGCGWGYDYSANCEFLEQLISAVIANGGTPGVYSSTYEWETVMGSRYACTAVSKYPIWYAHYDGSASFSDWSAYKFGGWSLPAIKQYRGDVSLCYTDVDENYY